jgi:TolB-like protein
VQQAMAERNAEFLEGKRIEFRIGVNLGDVIRDGRDIFGDGVNIAARLEALAEPGGICVSRVVHDQVRDKLDLVFEDMGEQQFKNIARPVHVWRTRSDAKPAVSASEPLLLPDKPSIAVLPFANMSGDPEQEYFADGVVEEITTALSRIRWLFVIARNSSFTYKGRAVDVKLVARELGVRYVLEGSVRKGGNRVRITGQLIDTTSGAHIWADRFEGALDDIFELQDLVASNVAGAIEPKLRQSEIERAGRKPTESLDAWDLYLRALALRYQYTEESIREAIAMLRRALAIDPILAPAAAMIGSCRIHQRLHRLASVSDAEIAEAVRLARGAIDAGKDDPDALWMAGWTLSFLGGEPATGANVIDRALTLNPNCAHAWMARGMVSIIQNRPDAAIEALERAIRLSPLDPWGARAFTVGLAVAYLAAGQYEQVIEWADRSLAAQPGYRHGLLVKVTSLAHLGRIKEARDCLGRMLELEPGLTIARWKASAPHYQPELLARYVEGLRKAGLPEQ